MKIAARLMFKASLCISGSHSQKIVNPKQQVSTFKSDIYQKRKNTTGEDRCGEMAVQS